MSLIEMFTSSNIDRPLYHYTGIGALMGMAETKSCWATSISYLNDSKELVHACELFEECLAPRLAFANYSDEKNTFLKN